MLLVPQPSTIWYGSHVMVATKDRNISRNTSWNTFRNIEISPELHPEMISEYITIMTYRRLGVKTGAERRPPPGIQAQHLAPAPHASHARHDRSMARNRLVARAKVGGFSSPPRWSWIYVPSCGRVVAVLLFISARTNKGFWEYMESTWSRNVWGTL